MTAYLPNVRFRVDWDNDSFLNGAVPSGTPPNLIPNAAYTAGINAAYVIDNLILTDGETKEVDEKGFTRFDADFNTVDKMAFGVSHGNEFFAVPADRGGSILTLDDYLPYNDKLRRITGVTSPTNSPVYGVPALSTVSGSTQLGAFNLSKYFPNGNYMIQTWVRFKYTTTGTFSSAIASIFPNTLAGTLGVRGRVSLNSSYGLANATWSDWFRVAAYIPVNDATGGASVTLPINLSMGFSVGIGLAEFQLSGYSVLPAEWRSVDVNNETPTALTGTANWNAALGTTGGYEMRNTGAGSYMRLAAATDFPVQPLIYRLTYTAVWSVASSILSHRVTNTSGGDMALFANTDMTVLSTPQTYSEVGSKYNYELIAGLTNPYAIGTDLELEISNTATSGRGVDIYDMTFEFLDVPETYWDKALKPKVQNDVIMASGESYNLSFFLKHDGVGAKDVLVNVYGITLDDGERVLLATDTVSAIEDYSRYSFEIATLSEDLGLYVELFQVATDVTLSLKAVQLTEGLTLYAHNVGSYASLDDLTSYIKTLAWRSGRNAFDEPIAYEGTMDLVLDNQDRRFSIENTASPYYGLLRQNLKVLLEIELDYVWYPLWAGWTRYFEVVAGTNSSLEVSLKCEQGMYRLREGSFSYAPTEDTRMDEVVKAIVHNSGWRSARSPFHTILGFDAVLGVNTYLQASDEIFSRIDSGKQRLSLVGMDWGKETTPDKALTAVLDAEQGKLWIDREGGLVLVNRNHLINAEDSFTTDLTLDTEVQDASYNFGEGIVNRIQVMYQEKKEVTNAVIWQSKSPIYIPQRDATNIYGKSTVRFPVHFTFEEMRQRTITKINSRISDFGVTVRGARNKKETTNWRGQVWVSVTSDGGNGLEVQIRNNFNYPIEVDLIIYGSYLEGGQSQVVVVEDVAAQEYIQAVHEKTVKTSVLSDLETAVNLAKWDISRYANPRGEFRVIETYVDSPTVLSRLLSWELGTILKISETQTGEVDRFHIIIAEEGSYAAGDTVRVTHRMARGDDNYYNKVGYSTLRKGTLNHAPVLDIVETPTFGTDGAKTKKVAYIYDAGDNALALSSVKYGGCVWFGNSDASKEFTIDRITNFYAQYGAITDNLEYSGLARSFFNRFTRRTGASSSGVVLNRWLAWANSKASATASEWARLPLAAGKLIRVAVTMYAVDYSGVNYTNIYWDADATNYLNTSTIGAISKQRAALYTLATTGESLNDLERHAVEDFIFKVPANTDGVYAGFSKWVNGSPTPQVGTNDYTVTDPTYLDMSTLENTTLKANTVYHVSLWGASEESFDVEVVIVEHNTANEIVIPITVSSYGKYTDTFTTSATLAEPRCSVFFRLKTLNTELYITGLAITEASVATLEEANTRQALAAYSFI